MVRRLRLALLIIAVGVTIYLVFPAAQTLQLRPAPDCGDFQNTALCHGPTPEGIAAVQWDAWLDFARIEVIVVVATAAL